MKRVGDRSYFVATIENLAPGDTMEMEEATAHLIAAAPDLLEACRILHKALNVGPQGCSQSDIDTIQSAIERATGNGKYELTNFDCSNLKLALLNKFAGVRGSRNKPLFLLLHEDYGWVPVIEIQESQVTWDDNQFDRHVPPNPVFQPSSWADFKLDLGFYFVSNKVTVPNQV